jgi:UDP-N-acetylmuramoylalanine-D-glutamate ligase
MNKSLLFVSLISYLTNTAASNIYDEDDEAISNWFSSHHTKANKVPFSISKKLNMGGSITDNNEININLNENHFNMPINQLALEGKHNVKNAMAATAGGRGAGAPCGAPATRAKLQSFKGSARATHAARALLAPLLRVQAPRGAGKWFRCSDEHVVGER